DIWRGTGESSTESRRLKKQEWDRLTSLITQYQLPCEMSEGSFSFGRSMYVYDHSEVPGVKPELLILITDDHLPLPKGKDRFEDKELEEILAPFTHSEANTELLAFYDLELPRELTSYRY